MGRRAATILIVLLAVLPALAALHSRSFFSPDETSYAQVAREMLETHDFVVPTIDGHAWLEKPPLVYWLLAALFAVFGWGFPAAVLLNSLLTAGTALVIAAHMRRLGTQRAALLAAVAYLTMFLPLAAARTALTDPALTLCTTGAVALFLAGGWPATLASGALLGLGVLAKGPVAPLVVVTALALAVAAEQRRAGWRRLVAALAVGVAVAAPWHLLLAVRGLWGDFSAVFFGRQVVSRAVDPWGLRLPWWFYLPALWLAAFPWGTHLLLAVRDAWRRLRARRLHDASAVAEAAAVLVPLVALSAAVNKLPHYVLPLMPWLAAWLGRAADERLSRSEPDRVARAVALATAVIGAGTMGAMAWKAGTWQGARFLPEATPLLLGLAGLVFAALGFAGALGRGRTFWVGPAVLGLACQLVLDRAVLPAVDRATLERPLGEALATQLPRGGVPIAHRWWRASFVAYGVRGWERSEDAGQLAALLASAAAEGRPSLVLVRGDAEGEARAAAWRAGGHAREVARLSGLGEIDGTVLEGIIFRADPERDGTRFFYDADQSIPGESGFSGAERNEWIPTFRWSVASTSRLPIAAQTPGGGVLRLCAWGRERAGTPQRLRLVLNDCPLGELTLARLPQVYTLPVPAGCGRPVRQELAFVAGHLDVPRDSDPASSDARTLAFALDWLSLDPASRSDPDAPSGR